MSTYDIKLNMNDKYPVVIYSVSYHNPIGELNEISEDLRKLGSKECDVLFDFLLSNGEEFNRFAVGHFDGKDISYGSIEVTQIDDSRQLERINKYYRANIAALNRGILTASQKLKYAKG